MKSLLPALLLLSARIVQAQTGTDLPKAPTLHGSGSATYRLIPQRAILNFVVDVDHSDSPEAVKRADMKAKAVVDALRAEGVPVAAMAAIPYSVNPSASPFGGGSVNAPTTFTARVVVRVNLDKIERLNALSATAMQAGATFSASPIFSADPADEARKETLKEAFGKAKRDAESIAAAAGGALGRLISVGNHGNSLENSTPVFLPASSRSGVNNSQLPELRTVVNVQAGWEFIAK
jgi:uncharacterized protein YggE